LAGRRGNLKFVNEPLNSRESESEAARSGKTIAKGQAEIGDAGAIVGGNNKNTAAAGIADQLEGDLAVLCIGNDVASQFGNGGCNESAINGRKPRFGSEGSALLASKDDVLI